MFCSTYLLKQKEILDAVHRDALRVQQAVELEAELPLGSAFRVFAAEAAGRRQKEQQRWTLANKPTSEDQKVVLNNAPSRKVLVATATYSPAARTRKPVLVGKKQPNNDITVTLSGRNNQVSQPGVIFAEGDETRSPVIKDNGGR